MSKMKMMGLMLGALAMSSGGRYHDFKYPKETEEERKKRLDKAKIEQNKSNGLKQFFYGDNSVWAINQKNADKKAKKNKWI